MKIIYNVLMTIFVIGFFYNCSAHTCADCKQDIEALSHSDQHIRRKAIANLATRSQIAVPYLLSALNNPEGQTRWGTAGALALIGEPAKEALPLLTKIMLGDENIAVRQMAQLAANQIGGDQVTSLPYTVRLTVHTQPGKVFLSAKPEHMLKYLKGEDQDVSTLILTLE